MTTDIGQRSVWLTASQIELLETVLFSIAHETPMAAPTRHELEMIARLRNNLRDVLRLWGEPVSELPTDLAERVARNRANPEQLVESKSRRPRR